MDRIIDPTILRRRRLKTGLRIAAVAGGVAAFLLLLSRFLAPSIDRDDIVTAVVTRGPIEGAIEAIGTVLPLYERTISSPGESRLLEVVRGPGSVVKRGERILALDSSELRLALDRTVRELDLAENRKHQLRLDLERTLRDLRGQLNIKTLRLEYLRSKTLQAGKMLEIGAISKDQADQARLEESIAAIEKGDLEQSIESTELSLRNQLDGVATQVNALHKERDDIHRQLDILACRAARDGVVTWTITQVGASVHRGDVVARIADLNSYRVEATLSDLHAGRVAAGMAAAVRLSDTTLPASVATVFPNIENGVLRIAVALDDPAAPRLRPNLRVDVLLVTSRRDGALKVVRGPFLEGGLSQDVFVVRGSTATRIAATVGVVNDREVEITGGLSEGDEIIISDMRDHRHHSTITIH